MNLTSAGVGSGLDLEGIIEAYVTAESVPTEARLQEKEDRIRTEISGIGTFKSALSTFQTTLKKLDSPEDFNKQTIDVSTSDIAVTTNGFASSGTFNVEVQQLAYGTRAESELFTSAGDNVGSGVLTFGVDLGGAEEQKFDVTIEATDTLSSIRDKINEQAENFGVVANVISTDAGTFLSYTSEVTGEDFELSISTSDASLDKISTNSVIKQNAQDAEILLDGNLVSNNTNEFKNVIEDVTINATKTNVGSPATITIAQDKENGQKLLEEFVSSYNNVIFTMEYLSNAETGQLAFDSSIRQMRSQLNSIVGDAVNGLSGEITTLADVGISLNKEGKLEISPLSIGSLPSGIEKRDEALDNSLQEVGELFASEFGVANKLKDLVDSYNDSDGTLTQRQTSLNVDLAGIPDEYEALETKLRNYEDTLRSKFTFLDQTVAYYNATSDWLTSALKVNTNDD